MQTHPRVHEQRQCWRIGCTNDGNPACSPTRIRLRWDQRIWPIPVGEPGWFMGVIDVFCTHFLEQPIARSVRRIPCVSVSSEPAGQLINWPPSSPLRRVPKERHLLGSYGVESKQARDVPDYRVSPHGGGCRSLNADPAFQFPRRSIRQIPGALRHLSITVDIALAVCPSLVETLWG